MRAKAASTASRSSLAPAIAGAVAKRMERIAIVPPRCAFTLGPFQNRSGEYGAIFGAAAHVECWSFAADDFLRGLCFRLPRPPVKYAVARARLAFVFRADRVEIEWCRLRDSNTRPPHYECDALPAELRRHWSDRHRAGSYPAGSAGVNLAGKAVKAVKAAGFSPAALGPAVPSNRPIRRRRSARSCPCWTRRHRARHPGRPSRRPGDRPRS